MKPERRSGVLLAITQSKAKMYEYSVPESHHIEIPRDPARLLTLTIGLLGDLAAGLAAGNLDADAVNEMRHHLRFSARYFDAYLQTHLRRDLDPYLLLFGSAAYYLCDLPGSASVLAARLPHEALDLGGLGLETLLAWLLREDFSSPPNVTRGPIRQPIGEISESLMAYYRDGSGEEDFGRVARRLRKWAYHHGTPRQLLLADTIAAVVRRRHDNAARHLLPQYSGLSVDAWVPVLGKQSFVRELWPSQRLLGDKGVFSGASAVVQMPTSAGKSRATEIVIRSAFLSGRASLAVVVAPFRALCHEIRENLANAFHGASVDVNELSDVFQADFDIGELLQRNAVVVVTPEKLVYVLRHEPDLAARVGLLIYDEGHQFDSGSRGVTYELLLTSLKELVPAAAQTMLISAVISNAEAVGSWLNGDDPVVATGTNLLPTERSVAFASWRDQLGRLEFRIPNDPDQEQFFVPRVIQSVELERRPREKRRFFPLKDGRSVALFLGLKLVHNGAVAIFCGMKATAVGIGETLLDAYDRKLALATPAAASDPEEIRRLSFLYEANLGATATAARDANIGVLTHHGSTPHGIRLAVEYAMKEGLARFVICTSTLAQGVNLPIRYLIVTSVYQGAERIKVRDFQNLIGRAGRSGMHTEGSVLFADPAVFDERATEAGQRRWGRFKELLHVSNSEPCASSLLSVLAPIQSDNGLRWLELDPLVIPQVYVEREGSSDWIAEVAERLARRGFSHERLVPQLRQKREALAAVESFLMAHWQEEESDEPEENVARLTQRTLAYHLASESQRPQLIALFKLLAENIAKKVEDPVRRAVFGRTLYGVGDAAAIEGWVAQNIDAIAASETEEELLGVVWPVLVQSIRNSTFTKWKPPETLRAFAKGWIQGASFGTLHDAMTRAGVRIGDGDRPRRPKVEQIVEIGENALGFDGALALGALVEFCRLLRPDPDDEDLTEQLEGLQKRLKYGLPSATAVAAYELGFADRVLAIELAGVLGDRPLKADIGRYMRRRPQAFRELLRRFPQYYSRVFERVVG